MKQAREKEIVYYQTETGVAPFKKWFDRLRDMQATIEVDKRLRRVSLGNLGDHKSVGNGVIELRIPYGPGYRIYLGQHADRLVVFSAVETNAPRRKTLNGPNTIGQIGNGGLNENQKSKGTGKHTSQI